MLGYRTTLARPPDSDGAGQQRDSTYLHVCKPGEHKFGPFLCSACWAQSSSPTECCETPLARLGSRLWGPSSRPTNGSVDLVGSRSQPPFFAWRTTTSKILGSMATIFRGSIGLQLSGQPVTRHPRRHLRLFHLKPEQVKRALSASDSWKAQFQSGVASWLDGQLLLPCRHIVEMVRVLRVRMVLGKEGQSPRGSRYKKPSTTKSAPI